MCPECYIENNVHVLLACSRPHLVVWAQFEDYPIWPAKVLNIDKATETLEVLFFTAEYSTAKVSCDDCFLYHDKDYEYTADIQTDMESDIREAIEVSYLHLLKCIKILILKYFPIENQQIFVKRREKVWSFAIALQFGDVKLRKIGNDAIFE